MSHTSSFPWILRGHRTLSTSFWARLCDCHLNCSPTQLNSRPPAWESVEVIMWRESILLVNEPTSFYFFVLLFIEMTQRATTLNVSASCLGGKKPIDWPRFTLSALFYFSFTRSCPAFFSVKRFIFGQVAYPLPPSPARQQEKRKWRRNSL